LSRIGIISALPFEAKCFAGRPLPLNEPVNLTDNIFIIISGIGAERAKNATERLLKTNVTTLISWGTAAGLVDKLRSGDLVLPKIIISSVGQNYLTDAVWNQTIYECLSNTSIVVHKKPLSSSNKLLNSPQEKTDHHRETGASAADMESAAIAMVAAEKKLPFIAIRSIVDEINRTIPCCVTNNIDTYGNANIPRLFLELLRSPQQIASLYHLARAMNKASYTLKTIANKIQDTLDI
jgi:adenosylhomocysteine nucleosidase